MQRMHQGCLPPQDDVQLLQRVAGWANGVTAKDSA